MSTREQRASAMDDTVTFLCGITARGCERGALECKCVYIREGGGRWVIESPIIALYYSCEAAFVPE